jgi:cell division protease FtsH
MSYGRHGGWRVTFLNYGLVFSALYVVFCVAYLIFGSHYRLIVAWSVVVPLVTLGVRQTQIQRFVDIQLSKSMGALDSIRVYSHRIPKYRYLDVQKAAGAFATRENLEALLTTHTQSLSDILSGAIPSDQDRVMKPPTSQSHPNGPGSIVFVPDDAFWVKKDASPGICIVRTRLEQYHGGNAVLEVGVRGDADPKSFVDQVMAEASNSSVFRGRLIELNFGPGTEDEFGDVVQGHAMDLRILPDPNVHPDDIILDDAIMKVLERNVLEFHRERIALRRLGLPGKRGLLLYGPPGTGKTFTTKYLTSQLHGVTTLVVAGSALAQIKAVCNAARVLQPALVVMEDVDLVYSSREINGSGGPLGDLMDELDGFGVADEIMYILTTNAIERVEAAIKDRPGRISQCVYLGLPTAELRRKYLKQLILPYTSSSTDLGELTKLTDGCTQAFIKELVYRAVQMCFATLPSEKQASVLIGELPLSLSDFLAALKEMRSSAGSAGESIIGFRVHAS